MNMKQMKAAVSKFRAADVSIIKDEKLRTKAQKLQAKQGGFTLLELLVVITLLATLATAALVAYEGLGENAADTAVANNLISAESAVRNFRAVESNYPNQWDNLANLDGDALVDASGAAATGTNGELFAENTLEFFGQWTIGSGNAVLAAVAESLAEVGIDEFQTVDVSGAVPTGLVPNLAFNESGGWNASELEMWDEENETLNVQWDEAAVAGNIALSIVPAGGDGTGCQAGSVTIADNFEGDAAADSSALNLINDAIGDEDCTLVIALGYGKDVPGTTLGSRVAISQVPTVTTQNVNPSENYARLIGLFQVGTDTDASGDIESDEIFDRARLIGFVDTEGRAVDTVLAAANEGGVSDDD